MTKRIFSVGMIAVVVIVGLAMPSSAHAQSRWGYIETLWYGYPGGWIPINPVNNRHCVSLFWMAICRVPLPKTPPPDDETNGDHPCCGSPISLASGNTFIAETDINMPGLGGGLHLARRWNSVWPQDEIAKAIGLFGPQWRSTYEEYVFLGNYNYMK